MNEGQREQLEYLRRTAKGEFRDGSQDTEDDVADLRSVILGILDLLEEVLHDDDVTGT